MGAGGPNGVGSFTQSSVGVAVGGGSVMIGSKPTLIVVPPMRFLIMDAPRQANLHLYIRECRKHHVTEIVRACEPTYHGGELQNAGIRLHEMAYEDGHSPSKELIEGWLQLVDETFYSRPTHSSSSGSSHNGSSSAKLDQTTNTTRGDEERAIAVHCVAGLGRAPVMVAIALIEFAAMDPVEAVTLIRRQRRGAINEKQLIYLEGYKRQYKRSGANSVCCVIS